MKPSTVLVPLDGSPLAEDALSHALAVYDCRVMVLNVVTPLDASVSESGLLEPPDERVDAARERAEEVVEAARARVEAEGRPIDTAVETGDPAAAILEYAADNDVDVIVMGGHGEDPGTLARRLLGTVTTTVVSEAHIPVTVVR